MDNTEFSTPSTRGQISMEDANKMRDKYYTPKSEEFHIGFRYERKGRSEDWDEYVYGITPGASRNINSDLSRDRQNLEGNYRVKYLDRDDIEELGWKLFEEEHTHDKHEVLYFFFYDNRGNVFQLSFSDEYVKIIAKGIDGDSNMVLFQGQVKNYNQLQQIMEMLNITGNEK